MARPRKQVDLNLLEGLARIGCTDEEIAPLLGISVDTLTRRFAESLLKARCEMKMSLRRTQLRLAEQGNAAIAIWLGKQLLGQHEPKTVISIEEADRVIDNALKAYNLPKPETFGGEPVVESEM